MLVFKLSKNKTMEIEKIINLLSTVEVEIENNRTLLKNIPKTTLLKSNGYGKFIDRHNCTQRRTCVFPFFALSIVSIGVKKDKQYSKR